MPRACIKPSQPCSAFSRSRLDPGPLLWFNWRERGPSVVRPGQRSPLLENQSISESRRRRLFKRSSIHSWFLGSSCARGQPVPRESTEVIGPAGRGHQLGGPPTVTGGTSSGGRATGGTSTGGTSTAAKPPAVPAAPGHQQHDGCRVGWPQRQRFQRGNRGRAVATLLRRYNLVCPAPPSGTANGAECTGPSPRTCASRRGPMR